MYGLPLGDGLGVEFLGKLLADVVDMGGNLRDVAAFVRWRLGSPDFIGQVLDQACIDSVIRGDSTVSRWAFVV